ASPDLCLEVRQSHSDLITKPGKKVEIFCSHDKTDFWIMLWYQRSPGDTAMNLVGCIYNKAVTLEYKTDFNISGDLRLIKNHYICEYLLLESSSLLFDIKMKRCANYDAYFGQGTKLTVLGEYKPGRSPTTPTVEVFKPSAKECNDPNKKRKKTLVCVASGFYPDHVSVSWMLNGVQTGKGVATDSTAKRDGDSYRITSRLKVQAKDWFRPGNRFTCTVSFFNGTITTPHSASVSCTLVSFFLFITCSRGGVRCFYLLLFS
uniref:Ig-like domain-containing protein n=1 Tax=Nothobranchius furzeri TaxID=105023 RepID=A0A8C6VVP9_NOTFU